MVKPNELGGLFENWDRDKNGVIDILEVLLYTANGRIKKQSFKKDKTLQMGDISQSFCSSATWTHPCLL
jgi:Ca2+-binding EF-hand superfamily protein